MSNAAHLTPLGPIPSRIDDAFVTLPPRLVILFCPPNAAMNKRFPLEPTKTFIIGAIFDRGDLEKNTESRRTSAWSSRRTDPANQRYNRCH
jgi:hypothetical protein